MDFLSVVPAASQINPWSKLSEPAFASAAPDQKSFSLSRTLAHQKLARGPQPILHKDLLGDQPTTSDISVVLLLGLVIRFQHGGTREGDCVV
ncbi:hypothetical protein EYC84_003678 [Monilinia fructicola]|uniref:Uncharacterized protein n=1 Tax=Monilinia fructicola TaxID=38448 RepID=A0A5M9JYD9_MONFR|nr:hypothetical protein EYC84_003678 [Monilinia fructicola]